MAKIQVAIINLKKVIPLSQELLILQLVSLMVALMLLILHIVEPVY